MTPSAAPSVSDAVVRGQTVEALIDRLGALTAERQVLRAIQAGSMKLEGNRIAIARAQWECRTR